MRPSERQWKLRESLRLMLQILADIDALGAKLDEMQGGFPSTLLGQSTSRSLSSPTETAAVLPDAARHAERQLDSDIKALLERTQKINNLRLVWLQVVEPMADEGPPGCRSHARLKSWEPTCEQDRTRCRWCRDWWLASSVDPTKRTEPPLEVLRARIEGRKITQALIDEVSGRGQRTA